MASDDSQELNIPGYNYAESILFTFGSESYIGENKLTTVFGATQINSGEARDFDATSLDALQQFHQAKTDTTTLEMRLDSDSSAKYPWTVGVYGMRDHGFRQDTFATGPQSIFAGLSRALSVSAISSTNITMASSYADILAALNACVTNDNCGAFIAPPSPANATGTLRSTVMPARANIDAIDVNNFVLSQTDYWRSNARMELKTQSTAVFGNVTIPLREDLSLFLGGRYSVLDKPYNYIGSTNAIGAPLVVAPFTTNSGTTLKEFDPKITLQKTYDNALGWVTYTTASKSGGPGFAQWSAADASKPYAAEELEMIELGYKAVLNDGATQVEAILYTYDYTDHQQILVGTNAAGNPAGVVVNGDATINGIELSYRTYLNENTNLALSYAGIDAEWDKFMDPRTDPFTDRAGEKMAFAPDNSINLALENVQYLNIGELTSAISIVYKDKYKLALVDWEPTTVDDLTLVNLTVGLDTPSGWNISAFCNNCTDDEYKMVALSGVRAQGGGNRYGFGDGRRIGLQLSTDF
jgi:outer membrane receptor protein involved in Fe transport